MGVARRPPKGRGALSSPTGRYEALGREQWDDGWSSADEDAPLLRTELMPESARRIISRNESPDIGFDRSINPYRGCEHGCVYCYARPTHAYLGLSPGLDFETKIAVKTGAPALLRAELARPSYRCETLVLGANTDPYQPVERRLHTTRGLLEVLAECQHPTAIVTKSALVERDLDLLGAMAQRGLAHVSISLATLDRDLARRMEPRASAPQRRLLTIQRLSEAGVPVAVLVAPLIPVLTDGETETILSAAREAGAVNASYVLLRLPLEVRDLFLEWLRHHYPLKAEHVMSRIRDTRGGRDYDASWNRRMSGTGQYAELLAQRFRRACGSLGFAAPKPLSNHLFKAPCVDHGQLSLF